MWLKTAVQTVLLKRQNKSDCQAQTLFLRGGRRPGAGAARITQPLGDKFLCGQSCLTTVNAAIEPLFKPLLGAGGSSRGMDRELGDRVVPRNHTP